MNKDSFQSSVRPPSGATRPLAPAGTGALPRVVLGAADPELRGKAGDLLKRLEPRIEFLIRVCVDVPLPMPGVQMPALKHPMPPYGPQLLEHLVLTLKVEGRLAQSVQVAIYRYQQIEGSVVQLDAAGQVDVELLRRNVFYLTNLSAEFAGNKILALIFPAPAQKATVVSAAAAASPEDKQKRQQQREEAVTKAVAFGKDLAPRMAIARLALETLQSGLTANVALVLTPQGRQAKMLAVALTGDEASQARLLAAVDGFEALKEAIAKVRNGTLDVEALRPIITPLGELGTVFAHHALLRDLFKRPVAPGA